MGADDVPRRAARVSEGARVRQRDVDRSDQHARRAHAGGSRGVEPRVGRRARAADDPHASSTLAGGTIQQLAFARRGPARPRPRLAARRCRCSSAGRPAASAFDVTLDGRGHDRAGGAGPAGADVGAARRRRARLRLLRSRSRRRSTSSTTSLHDDSRSAHARRGARRAVGSDARRPRRRPRKLLDELLTALPRETDELNVAADARRRARGVLAVHGRRTIAPSLAPKIEAVLRAGLDRATTTSHEGRVVRRAAQRRDDARDGRVARAGLAARGQGARTAARRKPTRPTSRSSSALRGVADAPTMLETELDAPHEPRSQGALRASSCRRCRPIRPCATRSSRA